ncbi:MAG: twin-arginine translocation signal domain-containing protein [bacterium]
MNSFEGYKKSTEDGDITKKVEQPQEETGQVVENASGLLEVKKQERTTKDEERLEEVRRRLTGSPGVSRRDFIKTGALAALGTIFGGRESSGSNSAENLEDSRDPKYKEGVDNFRKIALAGEPEHLAFYVKNKEGRTEWLDLGKQEKSMSIVPLDAVEAHKDDEELDVIHTHPTPIFSMPPSTADMFLACELVSKFDGNKVHIRNKVVDSHGVWEYKVSKDSNFFRLYKGQESVSKNLLGLLAQDEGFKKYLGKNRQRLVDEDPASINNEILSAAISGEMGEAAKKIAEEINTKLANSAHELKDITNTEALVGRPLDKVDPVALTPDKVLSPMGLADKKIAIERAKKENKRNIENLIRLWKKQGVDVTFVPHS